MLPLHTSKSFIFVSLLSSRCHSESRIATGHFQVYDERIMRQQQDEKRSMLITSFYARKKPVKNTLNCLTMNVLTSRGKRRRDKLVKHISAVQQFEKSFRGFPFGSITLKRTFVAFQQVSFLDDSFPLRLATPPKRPS